MKKSLKDLGDIKGKRALVRVDVNVPMDENKNVTDDTRIQAILPTVKFLKDKGAKSSLWLTSADPKANGKPKNSPSSPLLNILAKFSAKMFFLLNHLSARALIKSLKP